LLLHTFLSNIHVAWLHLLGVCSYYEECPNMKAGFSHMGTHPKECSITTSYQNLQNRNVENNNRLEKTRCKIRPTERVYIVGFWVNKDGWRQNRDKTESERANKYRWRDQPVGPCHLVLFDLRVSSPLFLLPTLLVMQK
jgi:hypothetical protein